MGCLFECYRDVTVALSVFLPALLRTRLNPCHDRLQRSIPHQGPLQAEPPSKSLHGQIELTFSSSEQLLLSAPISIVSEIEDNTINALRAATCVFSQQAAPPGSSCTLQAKFLERIVLEFLNKRAEKARTSRNASPDNLGSSHGPSRDRGASPRAPRLPNDPSQLLLDTSDMDVPDTPGLQQIRADFLFTDDTFWADMFVSAGFSLQDGVFFS